MKLLIAIPSRERAGRLSKTLLSIDNTLTNTDNVTVVIRVDEDDPQLEEYKKVFWDFRDSFQLYLRIGSPGKYCQLINEIASVYKDYDAFLCGTDDFICADEGWDKPLESLNKDKKMWLAWFDDEEKKTGCAQLPILSNDFVKYLGTPLHPDLGHFRGDMFVTDVACKLDIAHYIPTHRMIHMTPKTGKGPVDSTFLRVRMNEQILKDEAVYKKLVANLDTYIETLNKAKKID